MPEPAISVVMSVYNGAKYLRESVDSILSQEGVNLEFIIVNDGSTDESPAILEEYAKRDKRVRLYQQENQGLTKALIRGCAEAKGEFIARQDCGDISLPGKLAKQLEYFRNHFNIALLSCWSEAIGPDGEYLYRNERQESSEESTRLLRATNLKELKGIPGHPSAMFPRMLYEKVGGYRRQFYYAQDLDLWRRLTNYGEVDFVPEILYQFRLNEDSISFCMTDLQVSTTEIILKLSYASKEEENRLLEKASKIRSSKGKLSRLRKVNGYYFLGCVFRDKGMTARSISNFWKAILNNPFYLKAWGQLLWQLKNNILKS